MVNKDEYGVDLQRQRRHAVRISAVVTDSRKLLNLALFLGTMQCWSVDHVGLIRNQCWWR